MAELDNLFQKAKGQTPLMRNADVEQLLQQSPVKPIPKMKFNRKGLPQKPMSQFVKFVAMSSALTVILAGLFLFNPADKKVTKIESEKVVPIAKEVVLEPTAESPKSIVNEDLEKEAGSIKQENVESKEAIDKKIENAQQTVKKEEKISPVDSTYQSAFQSYKMDEIYVEKDKENDIPRRIRKDLFKPELAPLVNACQLHQLGFNFHPNGVSYFNLVKPDYLIENTWSRAHTHSWYVQPKFNPVTGAVRSNARLNLTAKELPVFPIGVTNSEGIFIGSPLSLSYQEGMCEIDSLIPLKVKKAEIDALSVKVNSSKMTGDYYYIWFTSSDTLNSIMSASCKEEGLVSAPIPGVEKLNPSLITEKINGAEMIFADSTLMKNLGFKTDDVGKLELRSDSCFYYVRHNIHEKSTTKTTSNGYIGANQNTSFPDPFYITGLNGAYTFKKDSEKVFHIYDAEFSSMIIQELVPVKIHAPFFNTVDSIMVTDKFEPYICWYKPTEQFLTCLPDTLADQIRHEYKVNVLFETIEDKEAPVCKFFQSHCSAIENMDVVELFPNPATNEINARFSYYGDLNLEMRITSLNGAIVKPVQNIQLKGEGNKTFRFDIAELPSGIYLLIINDENGVRNTRRFIKK